ncbi:MAG: hypothetical protein P8Z75_04505 [Gammaproteobacteria bacterium]|jgi:ElaB/YqjD/DUF883 family membrane-anchored ribosome-binding protein
MAETDLKKEMEQLRADLSSLRSDVADLTKALKSAGTHKAEDMKDSVEEELNKYREVFRAKLDEARAKGYEARDKMDEQIVTHPYASLLTAFGVGFIFAKLMHLGERH